MLYGRDAELARVAELVDHAGRGTGGTLVVRGGPGAGSTQARHGTAGVSFGDPSSRS